MPISTHRSLAECRGDVARFVAQYARIRVSCPQCELQVELPCPARLHGYACGQCGHPLDAMEWHDNGPVNHQLMQRLIRTCYREPGFAARVLQHFQRDLDRSVAPEWGIDKGLLLVHAANATVQAGHRSFWVYLSCLLGFVPLLSLLPLWLMKRRNHLNEAAAEKFAAHRPYEPGALPADNHALLQRVLRCTQADYPHNIFFFNGYDVFETLGQQDGIWSFLIDRRKRTGGEISDDPLSFDVNQALGRIRARTTRQGGPGNYPGRYRTREVVMVRGPGLAARDRRFLDELARPYSRVDAQRLEEERSKHAPNARVYTQVVSYDPEHDLSLASYVRVEHRGAFTYVESTGRRMLPVSRRLLNVYSAEPTASELHAERKLARWLRRLRKATRQRITFIALAFVASCFAWALAPLPVGGLYCVALLLVLALFTHGPHLTLHDKFEPRVRPWYLGWLSALEERTRRERVGFDEDIKVAAEFDYGPLRRSLRDWQARSEETQLDASDLRVLRRSQELTIQDTVIECLEESGIDTSDFREAAAQINNYGIINSGNIGGDAKAEKQDTGSHKLTAKLVARTGLQSKPSAQVKEHRT